MRIARPTRGASRRASNRRGCIARIQGIPGAGPGPSRAGGTRAGNGARMRAVCRGAPRNESNWNIRMWE